MTLFFILGGRMRWMTRLLYGNIGFVDRLDRRPIPGGHGRLPPDGSLSREHFPGFVHDSTCLHYTVMAVRKAVWTLDSRRKDKGPFGPDTFSHSPEPQAVLEVLARGAPASERDGGSQVLVGTIALARGAVRFILQRVIRHRPVFLFGETA
jgi:hypothetical protein